MKSFWSGLKFDKEVVVTLHGIHSGVDTKCALCTDNVSKGDIIAVERYSDGSYSIFCSEQCKEEAK